MKAFYRQSTKDGFSIVELVIVLAVVAVLGVVGYLAYTNLVVNKQAASPSPSASASASPSPTSAADIMSPTHSPVPPTKEQLDLYKKSDNTY